ncbi:DUF3119 family protein [Cyanobium sp. ATX 6A2]|jgi:hypothetical protein|uniref:DUF3119 family protein n=1 Tax=Cyanobium sp. ATX 6A2 TaxID=2823700 RepID=UPI0020CFA86A|nr:DUF3119 family protein [Cyanobium sp. ATX 6A2]MCP9886803.1 DUF3119 family protein [Cyanobium sp. ATX 6A2]
MTVSDSAQPVMLSPHYGVAVGVTGLGLACLALLPLWSGALWLALAVSLLGLFLMLQTALLRLEFSGNALLVRRGGEELRRFPYEAWLGWRLFWPGLPVVLYFRERQSIHLLPVLFNAASLRQQLQSRLPQLNPVASAGSASPDDAA